MKRRLCIVMSAAVIWIGTLVLASRLMAQPPAPTTPPPPPPPLKCVGVTAYPTPARSGWVTVVRAWEDGSLDARQYSRGIGEQDSWQPLR